MRIMREIQVWTVTQDGKEECFDRFDVAVDYLRAIAKKLAEVEIGTGRKSAPISLSYRLMSETEYQRVIGDNE